LFKATVSSLIDLIIKI